MIIPRHNVSGTSEESALVASKAGLENFDLPFLIRKLISQSPLLPARAKLPLHLVRFIEEFQLASGRGGNIVECFLNLHVLELATETYAY